MKDFLGRDFEAGQFIVYPVRRNSSLAMHRGEIVRVGPNYLIADYIRNDGTRHRVTIDNYFNVVICNGF